jgi:hypothetical protein
MGMSFIWSAPSQAEAGQTEAGQAEARLAKWHRDERPWESFVLRIHFRLVVPDTRIKSTRPFLYSSCPGLTRASTRFRVTETLRFAFTAGGNGPPWMPGSSPGMTGLNLMLRTKFTTPSLS